MALKTLLPLLPVLVMALIALSGLRRDVDIFTAMTEGARDGFQVLGRILPSLVCLLPAIAMLRASGAIDALTALLTPVLSRLGIPAELMPLMLLRPFSGSGALAIGGELMARCGADSLAGRTAAVMLGSTETTFYTVSVYFGAAGIRRTRYAVPAALLADLTGFLVASWYCRLA